MARSLGLAAYLALSRRVGAPLSPPSEPRPAGEVIWAHATSASEASALLRVFDALRALRPGIHMVMTHAAAVPLPDEATSGVICTSVPEEQHDHIQSFLSHWQPDLCLWTGGALRPALIHAASERGVAMFLVNADEGAFDALRLRWLPDLTRSTLGAFDAVFARNEAAGQRLIRLGLRPEALSVTGALQEGGSALPCDETTRDDLAAALLGRPIWLAANLHPDELPVITEAHRSAMRLAHRMLLVIVPDTLDHGDSFASALDDEGWRVVRWSDGGFPTETTQVLLADTPGEMGLWFRIAPVSFMGCSLVAGQGGRDPYGPAALGSAILYGPNVGRFLGAYSRLAGAGAARIVRDVGTLSAAVTRLTAPDQAATMAHAAWEVTSAGAEVTDRLLDLIQDALEVMEDR